MKKVPRGNTDVVVDNIHKILLVRWKDNSVVSVVSNISPVYPLVIDATIQNCWLLHRVDESNLPLLSFKRYIARIYLQQAELHVGIGRPRQSSRVIPDVHHDNISHLVESLGKQAWKCALSSCKSRPSQGCMECGVSLAARVFILFLIRFSTASNASFGKTATASLNLSHHFSAKTVFALYNVPSGMLERSMSISLPTS
ncbi:piggyBac transposable element-derived protein 2-like [Palaemon carinicauda]|uniref:piggyBac transposable element-derived protein 2-like n=1 Tax=Palaemon carinicauda TaxID=392227 RepID=UPI0035B61C47